MMDKTQAPAEGDEPAWYAVTSLRAPIIDKAIRRLDVAEEYADEKREVWPDVEVVPLYTRPAPDVQPKGPPADPRFSWMDFQQIGELPAVDEAIRNLLNDQTEDNGVCMIRAICEAAADRLVALAAAQAPAPAHAHMLAQALEKMLLDPTYDGYKYDAAKALAAFRADAQAPAVKDETP